MIQLLSLLIVPCIFSVVSNALYYKVLSEVNSRRGETEKFPFWGGNLYFFRVIKAHRLMFPRHRLRRTMEACYLLMLLSFLVSAARFLAMVKHR